MLRSLRVGILIFACSTAVLAIPIPEETVKGIEDDRLSLGAEFLHQGGYSQHSFFDSNFISFRNKTPQTSTVRTSHNPYIASDRTIHLKQIDDNDHYNHNLPAAYRLPLQRLSDKLLKQYSPNATQHNQINRVDMINKVQEQIIQRHARKLTRPKLLTNLNPLPEDITIDSTPTIDPVKNERTTIAIYVATPTPQLPRALPSITIRQPEIRRSQKQLPDIDEEKPHHSTTQFGDNFNKTAGLRVIFHDLERIKARYDSVRIKYLRRLRKLYERKLSLVNLSFASTSQTPLAPVTPVLPIVDNQFNPKETAVTTTTTTEAPVKTSDKKRDGANEMNSNLKNIVQKATVYQLSAKNKKFKQDVLFVDAETEKQSTPREKQQHKLQSGAPRAKAIQRQYVAKTVVEPVQRSSYLHDGDNEEVAEIATQVKVIQNDEVTTAPILHKNSFKFNIKKVLPEISKADLISILTEERKMIQGTPILIDSDNEKKQIYAQQYYEATTTTELPDVFTENLLTTNFADIEKVTETTPIPEVLVEASPSFKNVETSIVSKTNETEPEGKVITIDSEDELDLFAESDEEAICDAVACNFERGDLCQWEASDEEVNLGSPHYRVYRGVHYVRRTWHNWRGLYRNRVTGIARAQVFNFENERFAASYVRPFQYSTLTARLLSGEADTIRFRAWEATRDVQLRVCCNTTDNCVFETDLGAMRGSRQWREYTATCPEGSSKIIFECINSGVYQGACGVDNIYLANKYCPRLISSQRLVDSSKVRRHRKL